MPPTLSVALVSDVFFSPDGPVRLRARLREARAKGAALAVLPEIPLHAWAPASRVVRAEDAEPVGGPRQELLRQVAREVGIGVVGGVILRDAGGRRLNTAIVADAEGDIVATYAKAHLPEEPGFWETSHYEPGDSPPTVIREFGLPFGLQICSDANRPAPTHALAAAGAAAIVVPRATVRETWERWRLVFRASALTSCAYVLSVNRPAPEGDCPLGGPSIAVAPDGAVLAESTDPVVVVNLDGAAIERARADYPGYLKVRPELYERAWRMARETKE